MISDVRYLNVDYVPGKRQPTPSSAVERKVETSGVLKERGGNLTCLLGAEKMHNFAYRTSKICVSVYRKALATGPPGPWLSGVFLGHGAMAPFGETTQICMVFCVFKF